MKQFLLLLILGILIAACGGQNAEPASSSNLTPEAVALGTPAPAEIDAPLVESPALVKIRFLNERDGWGVTETQIVRTNDSGITWYNVTPPDVNETGFSVDWFVLDNIYVWIQQPDFANYPNSGFQFRTADGGLNWSKISVPYSGAKILFLDSNNGWALADLGVGAGSNAVAVYQTTDGGATWNLNFVNDPNHPRAGDSLPLGGLKYGLTAVNMQTAWIFGVVYAPGTPYVFRTDDSGITWSPVSLDLPKGAEDAEIGIEYARFVSSTEGFFVMRIVADQNKNAVYVTNDAGKSWSLTPTLIPGVGITDIVSASELVVYNREQFYITRDAARTWRIIPPDILFGEIFVGMDFVSASIGYVVTQDPTNHRSLYRTDDGGGTWLPVIP